MPEIDFFEITDAGASNGDNEDAISHWRNADGLVFAVADGVGVHNAGRVASTLALETLSREVAAAPSEWPVVTRLRRAVQAANVEIYQKGITVPELARMGTTLTVTAIVGGSLTAAHVGDCRLCLLRGGTLTQLTKDHTWVRDEVYLGTPPPDDAHRHPRRHELSRRLGQELIVAIDLLSMDLRSGDTLMHCSDGLHSVLDESEMQELLEAHPPEAACRALVRRARQLEPTGNLSVQVARVGELSAPPRRWWRLGF